MGRPPKEKKRIGRPKKDRVEMQKEEAVFTAPTKTKEITSFFCSYHDKKITQEGFWRNDCLACWTKIGVDFYKVGIHSRPQCRDRHIRGWSQIEILGKEKVL